MLTKINNAQEALQAFNENLEGLLTGKRKIPLAKEVNNTLGKACNEARATLMYKMWLGDKTRIGWYEETKQIEMPAQKKIKKAV